MYQTAPLVGIPQGLEQLHLLGYGRYVTARSGVSPHPGFSHWLLEHFEAGQLEVRTPRQGWTCFTAGQTALYPPGTSYTERLPKGQRQSVSRCVFFAIGAWNGLANLNLQPGDRLRVLDPEALLDPILTELEEATLSTTTSATLAFAALTRMLARLQSARLLAAGDAQLNSAVAGDLVQRAHHYFRAHLHLPVRVAEVAKALSLSESGFAHAYRQAAGQPPMAGLRALRVDAARALLLRGSDPLRVVAERCGFTDEFHLSRTFKQLVGVSPRQFRQQRLHVPQPAP